MLSTSLLLGSACTTPGGTDDPDTSEDPGAVDTTGAVQQSVSLSFPDRVTLCTNDARVLAGVVSLDICVGADLFLRETFNGNGRSCATCHRADDNFAIDPAFIARLPPDDPLFVAESNRTLAGLEIPAQMRRFGLILENVDGFLPDPRTHFVLRSVPHTLSMGTSVAPPGNVPPPAGTPVERTGWSGDGAPGDGSLRNFQNGAITQHYTKNLGRVVNRDFRLADSTELDRINEFMRSVGRTNELVLANVVMADARAEAGRAKFLAVGCNGCHTNAGANAGFGGGGNRNFNTGVETARHAALAAFPKDGGLAAAPANADGSFGDGTFNTPPLVEAADTGPFFHTAVTISGASAYNVEVAETIEEAIAFYDSPAFNNSPSGLVGPIDLTKEEIDNIGRFLRGINAAFNVATALKRLEAAAALVTRFHNAQSPIQRTNLRLAGTDLNDALRVLSEVSSLNASAISALNAARSRVSDAQNTGSETTRTRSIAAARELLGTLSAQIGSNLTYAIGSGSVMF